MTNKEKFTEIFGTEPDCGRCNPYPCEENDCKYWEKCENEPGCPCDGWWDWEFEEPTAKNDLSSGLEKNSKKLEKGTTKNDLGVDCISRAEAIKCLECDFDITGKENMKTVVNYINSVHDKIVNLPSVTPQEPRWIPVSEYLPVTNDEVLVTYIVNGNAKKRYVETANCFDGEWNSVNDEYRIPNTRIEIIAWCEMPKPYKAEIEPQESEE